MFGLQINPDRTLNLSIYAHGRERCDSLDALRKVPTPSAEYDEDGRIKWQPVAHASLVDEFKTQLEAANLTVVTEALRLDRDGQRFFGLFQVDGIQRQIDQKHIGTVFGIRNSHDKAFAASMCIGDAPFVCTNLAFSNEVTLSRKHTTYILRDLPQLIARAMGELAVTWGRQDRRVEHYHDISVSDAMAHDLIIRAFRAGAIGKTQIAEVAKQWHEPEHDDFAPRNGWSLYNSFTRALQGSVVALPKRSSALHGVLDMEFGLNDASKLVDTYRANAVN